MKNLVKTSRLALGLAMPFLALTACQQNTASENAQEDQTIINKELVLKLAPGDDNPRNSEGDFIELAAGVLFGIHEGWDMKTSLRLGVCAAAASLSNVTCSDGVKPYQECFDLIEIYGYRQEEMT